MRIAFLAPESCEKTTRRTGRLLGRLCVALLIGETLPLLRRPPIAIPHHLAALDGDLRDEAAGPVKSGTGGIQKAELAFLQLKQRNVGYSAGAQVAQFFVMNLPRGI